MVPLDQLPAHFDVKVVGSGHDLPSKAHIDWLVCPEPCSEASSSEIEEDEVRCCYVGVGVSVRGRSVPDAIVLSYAKRLLVIRFKSIYTKKRASLEMMSHVARFLADLSRHTLSSAASSSDSRQQQQEYRVVLVCFQGAILALLLYQTLKLRFSVVDLSSRSSKSSESSDFQLIQARLGSDAAAKLGRLPYERLLVIDAALNLKQPLRGFLATMRLTISAHLVALHYSRWSSTGVELEPFAASQTNYESTIVSTRCVAQQVVDHLSTCAQVHSALHLMAGKTQTANLAMDANGSSVEYTHQEGRSSICVTNTDFRTKLGKSSRQELKISTLDGAVLRAKTTRSEGRTSTLDIHGVTAGLANLKIASVEVMGRPDRASDYSSMVRHWTDLLRVVEIGQDSQTGEMVPVEMSNSLSGLCGALLFNHRVPQFQPKYSPSSILCSSSSSSSLTAIASDTLNESQRLAAEAVFAPLPSHDWRQCPHDPRILLVHGPPGTGKTKVIATVCKQFAVLAGGARTDEAVYAACQSNTAVKNIGEALERAGVDFKILVSPNFYVDWHEDLYAAIKARLLVTDRLMASPQAFREQLGSSMVVLMTISGLSAARYTTSVPLFEAKRMRMLLVDEASQIHLSAYPHILRRFENTLSRVVFFGDDEQLAPFGSDDVAQAGQSVFELEHLREHAHLLDTSYRLPRGLCEFISEAVYGGQLHAAQTVSDRTLSECVAFVDVDRGRHVKGRTTPSLVNTHEAETVVRLVRYLRTKAVGFKVLTAYDAQRNEIETRLKKQGLSGSGDVVFNIDAFQGQETDVVVASLVRDGIIATTQTTENQAKATVGFLKNQRRTNVLLTRCKRLVIVVSSNRFVTGAARETLIGKLESQASEQDGDIWTSESDVMNGRFERLDELLAID